MRAEREIYRSLLESDFTVRRVFGISSLHRTLFSQSFDAIVVSQEFMALRRISPSFHLKMGKSPVSIVAWGFLTDGSKAAEAFCALDLSPGSDEYLEKERLHERICRAIEAQVEETSDTSPAYGRNGLIAVQGLPIPDLAIHRKMRLILDAIARTGDEGIGPDDLTRETWGPNSESRRKDLHSYISKLRKALLGVCGSRYRIVFRDRRYRLLDAKAKKPPTRG